MPFTLCNNGSDDDMLSKKRWLELNVLNLFGGLPLYCFRMVLMMLFL